MKRSRRPPAASALLVLCLAVPASAAVETLPPGALSAGQKATVWTVFEGARVDSFAAEIVGVLDAGRAAGSTILARATSERVVRTGIAQGMSGSPVYVDGKLVGALSSGWAFTREPIFGITPIGEMLDVLAHPTRARGPASAGPAGAVPHASRRSAGAAGRMGSGGWAGFTWSASPDGGRDGSDDGDAVPVGRGAGATVPLPVPLAASGLHGEAFDHARDWLAPHGFNVVPGGTAAGGGPPADALVPGAAVAIDVLRGDLLLSAIGTVTWREGDRVLLFGHPFFQAGEVRMPMSTAEITTVVGSDLTSFKLGVRGREAGVVDQDRRAAVGGRIGGRARMLPVRVGIARPEGRQVFRFESIEDRTIAPALVRIAALSSLLEAGGAGANETFRWTLTLHAPGRPRLEIADVSAGSGPGEVAGDVARPLGFLFDNPYESLALDSLTVDVDVRPGVDVWTLRDAMPARAVVRPGETIAIQCRLARWRGDEVLRRIEVRVPEHLADGTYTVWIGGGRELGRAEAQRFPARFRPESLDEAWTRIAALRPASVLCAVLVAPFAETTVGGRDYVGLPPAAATVLAPSAPADRTRRDAAWLDESRLSFDGRVSGETTLRITVDRGAPR